MKKVSKWTYLLLFLGTGVIYLSCVDHWEVYTKPLAQAKNWYQNLEVEEKLLAYTNNVQAAGEPSFIVGKQEGQDTSPDASGIDNMETSDNQVPGSGRDEPISIGDEGGTADEGETGKENPEGAESGGETPPDSPDKPEADEGSGDGSEGESPEGEASEGGAADEKVPEDMGPRYMTVEDDYFADAVFIGDSRTMGLFEYGDLEETAEFYCSRGLTVFEMFEAKLASVPDSKKKISVEEALQQKSFSKIYLMIGINEMGGNMPPWVEEYKNAVEKLKELQPDAIIYVQAIIKVTAKRSAQGDYITNEGIDLRNEAIAQLADNEKVFYLDVNPLICDETGGMIPDYTTDGVHLKAKYIEIWKDFLKTHAICLDE